MFTAMIWGIGRGATRLMHYLDLEVLTIVGVTDNSGKNRYISRYFMGYPYLPIFDAIKEKVDFFIIGSQSYCEITNQLLGYGIKRENIIQAYNVQFMLPDTLFYFNEIETDQNKYKVFKSLDSFACMSM